MSWPGYGEQVADFVQEASTLWHESGDDACCLSREYTSEEQRAREIAFDECLQAAENEMRRSFAPDGTPLPGAPNSDREERRSRLSSAFARFAAAGLDLEKEAVVLLQGPFAAVGFDLAREARLFDPQVALDDVLQACRNAWTACGLQPLLGQAMRLTPAIFAYSMLYPYSDNYMDDPEVDAECKLRFSARFRERLLGNSLAPLDAREAAIWKLIERIEQQYSRAAYPLVYDSLLAIHCAQEASLHQLDGSVRHGESDLIRLSCAKGGASVLADAALAAGCLGLDEARFAFEWGVLLQLGDDLQDLRDDLARGSATVFSCAVHSEPLDRLTNRLLGFADRALSGMARLEHRVPALEKLLQQSSRSVVIRAAANAPEFYSPPYMRELERYSPLRFEFLRKRQDQLTCRQHLYAAFFEDYVSDCEERSPRLASAAMTSG